MQLVGHSLGAYLACCYALKYPERVSRLVLLSPAGVPRGPNSEVPAREVTADQESIRSSNTTASSSGIGGRQVENASRENVREIKKEQMEEKKKETRTQQLFTYLWEEGWSPFQIIRTLNVFGPMLIGKVNFFLKIR